MIFKKKTVTIVYTVRRCGSCGKESRSEFVAGDCLFAGSDCPCGKKAMVEKIFCNTMPAS